MNKKKVEKKLTKDQAEKKILLLKFKIVEILLRVEKHLMKKGSLILKVNSYILE